MKKQIQRGYVVCSRLQDKSKVDPSVRLALHHANMSWRMVRLFEHLSLDSMLQTIEKERDKRRKRKRDKEKEEGGNASVCYDVSASPLNSHVCVSAQPCPTLRDPMDCGPPGSCPWEPPGQGTGVGRHFLLRGSSRPRDQTHVSWVSCIAGRFFPTQPPGKPEFIYWNPNAQCDDSGRRGLWEALGWWGGLL